MLLHEFDPNPAAMINPSDNHSPIPGCPKVAVSCFERHTFERMAARLETEEIGRGSWAVQPWAARIWAKASRCLGLTAISSPGGA